MLPTSISPSVAGRKSGTRVDFYGAGGQWMAAFDADEVAEFRATGRVNGVPCLLVIPSSAVATEKRSRYDVRHVSGA